jgi:hypothetical protein
VSHEFRDLANQSHETFTLLLIAGGVGALIVLAFALYLRWRHGAPNKQRNTHNNRDSPSKSSRKRRRK